MPGKTDSHPHQSEYEVRLANLKKLKNLGVNPYPSQSHRTHNLKNAREAAAGTSVVVTGRLMTRREMGKLTFCHLKDFSGRLQAAFSEKELGQESYTLFANYFDIGDFVEVTGEIFTTHKGEISVLVKKFSLLSKALLPLPEKWHGITDVEQRFRKRYLDLIMNDSVGDRFVIRSKIISALRDLLDKRGFLEIETPTLQPLYGGGFARPFKTHHNALNVDFFLRISDEMYLKRAIVGGFDKVYEITKVFRNEGIDHDHNPEFTMFEAQVAYEDYRYGMDIFEEIFEHCAKMACGYTEILHGKTKIDVKRPWPRFRLIESVQAVGNFDFKLDWTLAQAKEALRAKLSSPKKIAELETKQSVGEVLAFAFEELVEEKLIQPTIIYDYPVEVSPLAKKCSDERFTERFEAFALGSEIGNNYSELNDPLDLEQRFIEEKKKEAAGFEEAHQTDYDYLEAIKHGMPPICGLGIGIDRMVMLLTGSDNIKEVIMFPTLRPLNSVSKEPGKQSDKLSDLPMNREEALRLLKKYNHKPSSFNHYLESEAVMRALARKFDADEEWWGIAGLLHDIDWDLTSEDPKNHLTKAPALLKEAGFPDDFIEVVLSHGYGCDCAGLENKCRTKPIEHALAAAETVTGLIHASALMRPDKIASLTLESVLKKFKNKSFAAKVNRDVIKECEKIDIPLEEFLELAINAIKTIAKDVELA